MFDTKCPLFLTYAVVRRFHRPAAAMMVATASIEQALTARGFTNIRHWTRGVDTELFHPCDKSFLTDPRPIPMYVGRASAEQFLSNLKPFTTFRSSRPPT